MEQGDKVRVRRKFVLGITGWTSLYELAIDRRSGGATFDRDATATVIKSNIDGKDSTGETVFDLTLVSFGDRSGYFVTDELEPA